MSQVSEAAKTAASVDWTVVATGSAVFIGTVITTIWGWVQGKKKVEQTLSTSPALQGQVPSVIVQDNSTLREQTLVQQAVRDQLLLTNHALTAMCKATEDNTSAMDDVLTELKAIRRSLETRG